jgi:hypothetical protein
MSENLKSGLASGGPAEITKNGMAGEVLTIGCLAEKQRGRKGIKWSLFFLVNQQSTRHLRVPIE